MANIGPVHIPFTGRPVAAPIAVDPDVLTATIVAIMNSPDIQGSAYGKLLQGETARAILEHVVPAAERGRFNRPVTVALPEATDFGLYNPLGDLTRPLATVLVDYGVQRIGPTEQYSDLLEIPAGGARRVRADVTARIQDRANGLLRAAREAGRELTPQNAVTSATAVEIQRAELRELRRSSIAYAMSMAEYAAQRGANSRVNTDNFLMFTELLPPTARVALQFYKTTPGANMDRILQNVNTFYATLESANIQTPDAELAGLRDFTQFMQGYVMEEMSGLNTAPAGAPAVTPLNAWAYGTNRNNPIMGQYTPTVLRGQAYAKAGFTPIESWMFHQIGPRI